VRLWRERGRELELVTGQEPGWRPPVPRLEGEAHTPDGTAWFSRLGPDTPDLWVELALVPPGEGATLAEWVVPVVAELYGRSREAVRLSEALEDRTAENELLYVISEVLGQALDPREAAQTMLRELSERLQARRASLLIHDVESDTLRIYAARGYDAAGFGPIPTADPRSIAAKVFRERRPFAYAPGDGASPGYPDGRTYVGRAFLSVPVTYAAPGSPARCVGVLNFTDRIGNDAFTPAERRLVAAVANQVGAAIENVRLVARDLQRQRLSRELELAHDLQLRLLPAPSVLQGDAEVAARCRPVESVGGDFYTFARLGRGRVGVMLGDVSSHGFSAALVMALVMSAAGIHAGAGATPDETLTALFESLGPELARTEMYFSVFYGVLDPERGRLDYSSAGHPYAWKVTAAGAVERLDATSPPLGLSTGGSIRMRTVPWAADDLLVLCTDGLLDARNAANTPWGEARLHQLLLAHRSEPAERIVETAIAEADAWTARPQDDRTLLVMRR
jgi:sigma-B regulation protein RsbU (phosphoserine phosphatase)